MQLNQKAILGIVITTAVIFLFGQAFFSSENTKRDILLARRDYRDPTHFTLDSSKFPTVDNSTEEDVYQLLGTDLDRRLTFKSTRQKTINGKTLSYNKILLYENTLYKYSEKKEGEYKVKSSKPLEQSQLVIFLLDGKITHFAALHATRPDVESEYVPTSKSKNLDDKGKAWPGIEDDIYDYYKENGMEHSSDTA